MEGHQGSQRHRGSQILGGGAQDDTAPSRSGWLFLGMGSTGVGEWRWVQRDIKEMQREKKQGAGSRGQKQRRETEAAIQDPSARVWNGKSPVGSVGYTGGPTAHPGSSPADEQRPGRRGGEQPAPQGGGDGDAE